VQRRTAFLFLTAPLALAAVVFLVARLLPNRTAKREPIGLESVRAEIEETRRDLASLKRSQALLTSQRLAALGSAAQGTPGLDPDGAGENAGLAARTEIGSPPEEMDEEMLQRVAAEEAAANVVRFERLARDLESEPRDSAWANEIERAYRNQVDGFEGRLEGTKPSIVSLECRTSLCRLELAFSTEEDAHQYGPQLAQNPLIKRGTFRHIKNGREVRTVAFLGRDDRNMYPLRPSQARLDEH
jgi:hypothetical protein